MAPAAWWRPLLVVTYSTGLRAGTLFSMKLECIDWDERGLVCRRLQFRQPRHSGGFGGLFRDDASRWQPTACEVHPRGLEPLTFGSVDRCSIQLS